MWKKLRVEYEQLENTMRPEGIQAKRKRRASVPNGTDCVK